MVEQVREYLYRKGVNVLHIPDALVAGIVRQAFEARALRSIGPARTF